MPTTAAPGGFCRVWLDFRVWIGHGEEDRIRGHGFYHIGGDAVRGRDADKHVGMDHGVGQGSRQVFRIGNRQHLFFCRRQAAVRGDDAFAVAEQDLAAAQLVQHMGDGASGSACAVDDHLDGVHGAAGQPEGIVQGGTGDDGGAVLIVVEYGNVQLLLQTAFYLKAGRRGDILQIDAAEARRDILYCGDDLFRILGRKADGEGVDARQSA